MDERVLLVDLCGTLYDSNTTFDFLKHFLADDEDYARFEALSRSLPYRLYNRLMPGDRRRERAVSFLAGYERAELKRSARDFLSVTRPVRDVQDFVTSLRSDHDRTMIISSSLDFIVEAACEGLGFEGWFATRLVYEGNVCEGRIAEDLLGQKQRIISRDLRGTQCTLVTDNHEDVACREVVQRFIGVAPAEHRREVSFWSTRVTEVVAWRE